MTALGGRVADQPHNLPALGVVVADRIFAYNLASGLTDEPELCVSMTVAGVAASSLGVPHGGDAISASAGSGMTPPPAHNSIGEV